MVDYTPKPNAKTDQYVNDESRRVRNYNQADMIARKCLETIQKDLGGETHLLTTAEIRDLIETAKIALYIRDSYCGK